ncbi:MAG: DNA/RNA non-specific endonuclease, partial [Conexibacteraceae bacterium]|nr:DNA/RNA non-specific endonuclease [Conexibacteraceae bacterium]
PQPNNTYLVDGTVYHMDGLGRPDDVHAEQLTLGNADRSPSVQSRIGDQGGPGYEGGHLVANMFGGGPEDHNLVPMLQSVNRGSGSSFGNLEGHWQSLLNKNPDTKISVDINLHYGGASKVPDRMTVNYSINGVQQKPQRFMNG